MSLTDYLTSAGNALRTWRDYPVLLHEHQEHPPNVGEMFRNVGGQVAVKGFEAAAVGGLVYLCTGSSPLAIASGMGTYAIRSVQLGRHVRRKQKRLLQELYRIMQEKRYLNNPDL